MVEEEREESVWQETSQKAIATFVKEMVGVSPRLVALERGKWADLCRLGAGLVLGGLLARPECPDSASPGAIVLHGVGSGTCWWSEAPVPCLAKARLNLST